METTEPRTRGGWKLSAPSEPKGTLRRTPRVLGLLYELFDNEWMHSGHLKALDAGEKTDRLLLRMAQHHLVSRLTLEWGWKAPPVGGQPPQLYELSALGAYDLAAAGMISAPPAYSSLRHRLAGRGLRGGGECTRGMGWARARRSAPPTLAGTGPRRGGGCRRGASRTRC